MSKETGVENIATTIANRYFVYNETNPEARGILIDVLTKATGVPRKTKQAIKDGKPAVKDGKPVLVPDETENDYIKRALAQTGKAPADFQVQFEKACEASNEGKGIRCDARESERKAKAIKLAEEYIKNATWLLAPEQAAKFKGFQTAYRKVVGKDLATLPADDSKIETLGWAIREYVLEDARQRKNTMFGVA
jgi:hypothetical protein